MQDTTPTQAEMLKEQWLNNGFIQIEKSIWDQLVNVLNQYCANSAIKTVIVQTLMESQVGYDDDEIECATAYVCDRLEN